MRLQRFREWRGSNADACVCVSAPLPSVYAQEHTACSCFRTKGNFFHAPLESEYLPASQSVQEVAPADFSIDNIVSRELCPFTGQKTMSSVPLKWPKCLKLCFTQKCLGCVLRLLLTYVCFADFRFMPTVHRDCAPSRRLLFHTNTHTHAHIHPHLFIILYTRMCISTLTPHL